MTNKFKATPLTKEQIISMIIVFFACLGIIGIVHATTYKSLTVDEIVEATELAFQAKVLAVEVELRDNNEGSQDPWTQVTFEIIESLKGNLSDSHSLYFYGGITESQVLEVEAMPRFRVDEELLLFSYDAQYYSPIVGFSQGLFRLDEGAWQSEMGQWLIVEEEKLILTDTLPDGADSTAVITKLQTLFQSDSTSVNDQENSQEGGQ